MWLVTIGEVDSLTSSKFSSAYQLEVANAMRSWTSYIWQQNSHDCHQYCSWWFVRCCLDSMLIHKGIFGTEITVIRCASCSSSWSCLMHDSKLKYGKRPGLLGADIFEVYMHICRDLWMWSTFNCATDPGSSTFCICNEACLLIFEF